MKKRIAESFTSTDSATKSWKMRFSAAYEEGKFADCERLLHSLLNQADGLKERDFAVNTTNVALGALYQAMGR